MNKIEIEEVPVFIINGFLEAGKTNFIKFTMEKEYFKTEGKTILILTEEGEEEFEKEELEKANTILITKDDIKDLDKKEIKKLILEYKPERIVIEWNGLWMQDELVLPNECFIHQIVSIFDTSTLDLYLKNMKAYMGPMLRNSELIICNRADDIEEEVLARYHLSLRAMARDAEIVFEGKEGEIRGDFSIELPYNLDDEVIKIEDEYFGIFYIDSIERREKYENKVFEFVGQVLKPPRNPFSNIFVPVRKVMTCCEDDMQYLGHVCEYEGAINFKNKDWVKLRAKLVYKYHEIYRQEGPVFIASEVVHTKPIDKIISI